MSRILNHIIVLIIIYVNTMKIYIYDILRGDFEEMPKFLITYKLNNF